MSRIGKQNIRIPEKVEVSVKEKSKYGGVAVIVKGPLGELKEDFRPGIAVEVKDSEVNLKREMETRKVRAYHGLYRTLIANMIEGVTKGFEKKLEMVGIGYRAKMKGKEIEVTVGATHPHIIEAIEGISFEVKDKINIWVKGINKQKVGLVAASIRELSKPEPYKGKGIRYSGEYVRRKAGKAAKAAGEE